MIAALSERRSQDIWMEQCRATRGIRERFGLQAAFDYIVSEKADAAATRAEFARELPRFVAEVRQIFTQEELESGIAKLGKQQRQRLQALRELLIAPRLGTS